MHFVVNSTLKRPCCSALGKYENNRLSPLAHRQHDISKVYKKIGFEVIESNERHSVVRLGAFDITLVNVRDEDELNHDSLSSDKGRGMYVYVRVDDADALHAPLVHDGMLPSTTPRN